MATEAKQAERDIVAANLKRLCLLHGKKQVDIVRDLGMSQSVVSDYFTAKKYPQPDKMQALADYFGVMKSDIMENKPRAVAQGSGSSPVKQKIIDFVVHIEDESKLDRIIQAIQLVYPGELE